jgi:hypothetical protein
LNKGHQQGISLTLDDNITSEYLKARNDVVYIQTTREQDDQILQNVVTKINNVDTEPYRLWSNSCVDSFSDVLRPPILNKNLKEHSQQNLI